MISMSKEPHDGYMAEAIALARRAEGRTSPNPPVGAMIVRAGKVVGRGFHPQAGQPHAEVFALREAGTLARDADLYVTLEPCSHHGKTPPCADAIIAAGLKRVFVGVIDPNPKVAGCGVERLRAAGIEVRIGILDRECRELIVAFSKYIRSGMPFTIYKAAMTLDGATATQSGDSRWISGVQSRELVHQLRNRVDAIMVGGGTVRRDDPQLTTRLAQGEGRDPVRVVVDSRLRMPVASRMLSQQSPAPTLVATICADREKIDALERAGAEVLLFPADSGVVPLADLWRELGRRQIQSMLLEGGATLAGQALKETLIDRLMVFIAPKILGGASIHGLFQGSGTNTINASTRLDNFQVAPVGGDLLVTGDLHKCSPD